MAYSVSAVRADARSLATRAGSDVGMMLQPAIDYVLTVGANNPPAKVAARSDVRAALEHAASGALTKALPTLELAWVRGWEFGSSLASEQGIPFDPPALDSTLLLVRLRSDVENILREAPSEILRLYQIGGDIGLERAQRRTAYRVSLAVEAALKHAQAEAFQRSFENIPGLHKEWTVHSLLPCSDCLALASLGPIPWTENFPTVFQGLPILGVYADVLFAPPRHPHCACTLRLSVR